MIIKSLKLETQESGVNINAASFTGTTIIGASSNARARIVASQAATSSTQPTLMFHYLSGDTFDDGETVAAGSVQATTVSAAGPSGITGATGNGSVVSVDTGVFYVGGFFLFTPANTVIMEAYSEVPSGRVGLEITESTKTSDDDGTLLDPASGTYNFAAPGAARYKIELALKIKSNKQILNIVSDKLGTPTYTYDFANNLKLILENELSGVFNLVCEGETSRLEVAHEILKILNLEDIIKIREVDSSFFHDKYFAARPFSERLENQKLNKLNLNIMRNWKICLKEYLINYFVK